MELIFIAALCIFITGFLLGRYRRRRNENIGERYVMDLLSEHLPPNNYHLLNNITIPTLNGSTQIDHILISTKGIFVIETKHYSGWIFGDAQSKTWMQIIYKSKHRFQNPVHQNYGHIQCIRSLLDFLDTDIIHSLVVFTGDAEFKSEMIDGVYYLDELLPAITSFKEDVISLNRMQFCVGRIECARYQLSEETDIEHIRNLEAKYGK